jgi:hypothetical protein
MSLRIGVCSIATLALAAGIGIACGSGGGGSPASGGASGTGATAGASGASGSGGAATQLCTPGSGAVELTGQWGLQANLNVKITGEPGSLVELCPNPQNQPASLLLKVDITGSGTNLTQTTTVCEITMPVVTGGVGSCANSQIETEIKPSAALQSHLPNVKVSDVPLTLAAAEVGQAYSPAQFWFVLGAALTNPATDPLPKWDLTKTGCSSGGTPVDCVIDLAKVTDDDGDSDYGVSLEAYAVDQDGKAQIEGNASAVLRVAPYLTGTIRNPGCVEGTLTSQLQYSIVDSDVTLAGAPITTPQVIQQLPPFEILPDSKFRMLRANGQGDHDFDDNKDGIVSCAEIRNHIAAFQL